MGQNYQYDQLSYATQLKGIQVPKFQRSLVWSTQKKLDLLKTLHKDFPFGALLVSPLDGSKQRYRLLDGQQRLATIKDFESHRLRYWKQLNQERYAEMLKQLNARMVSNHLDPIDEKTFDQLLDENYDVADWTDQYTAEFAKYSKRSMREFVGQLRQEIKNYINLDTLSVPVINFLGDEADLPEVYENLNRGGVPLTKYEVLNAAWSDALILIPESALGDQILNAVKDYYNHLRAQGAFELENFSEDEITRTRTVNLAEFARALGELVVADIPALVQKSAKLVNEMGFGILGIALGIDNKKIATMHNQIGFIKANVAEIINRADALAKRINTPFAGLFKQNVAFGSHQKAKKDQFETGLSTTFKVLSYFANLWEMDDGDIVTALANIPTYYVYDYVRNAWNAHGDQLLYGYYHKMNIHSYLKPVDNQEFTAAFQSWVHESNGIRKTFSKEIKALITVHANLTYLAAEIPASEDYEFEHVVAKARVLRFDNGPHDVYLSSLGNGMFLPKGLNNAKSERTLYEFEQDPSVDYQTLIADADYFSRHEFERIALDLEHHQFDAVNQFLVKRALKMVAQIVSGLDHTNGTFFQISHPGAHMHRK